ncbi:MULTISPECIES: TPR repeat region-containing protein [unclassified Rhodococcus (in: high G+C Gram-positive bacteria)]|uniref:TPR repeat region-containing protein n=1 Tax=Rhodococcus sp. SJ-3 TaxID=3454628 RepID=UPI003F78C553
MAASWAEAGATLDGQFRKAGDTAAGSYTFWTEHTGDTMRSHVHNVLHPGRTLATGLADAATELTTHAGRIQDALGTTVAHVLSARESGFSVADDGTVTPPPPVVSGAPDSSGSQIIIQMAALSQRANILTRIITADLVAVDTADTAASTAVADAFVTVRRDSDLDPNLLAHYGNLARADAAGDGSAARNGTLTPEDLQRIGDILIAAQLSPAQLDALARGDSITSVPTVALNYLRDFYREAGTDGLLDVAEVLRTREESGDDDAASRLDALANGLLTISNENVGDGNTTGGYDLVPDALRDTLSRINETSEEPRFSGDYFDDVYSERRLGSMAALLGEANPGVVPGKEFANELDHAASRLIDISSGTGGLYRDSYEPVAEKFLDIGLRNEDASYELLTASDNTRTLMPLFEHNWNDDGATLGRLVDWIPEDSAVTDPDDTVRAERAGEAAHSLALMLSSSGSDSPVALTDAANTNPYGRLMDIPGVGDGRAALGEVNPALTQSIAGALSPYVIDMVTDDPRLAYHDTFDSLGPVETTRIYSLLDSDPHAGTLISGHALAAAEEIDRAFARSEVDPPPISLGETSGRLRAVVEGGLRTELGDRSSDADEAKSDRAATRAGHFGAGQAITATGLSYLPPPWGVAASGAVYTAGALISGDIIDADGNLTDRFSESPEARFRLGQHESGPDQVRMTDNEIKYTILTELVDSGRVPVTDLPPEVTDEGTLITYGELMTGRTENIGDLQNIERVRQGIVDETPRAFERAGIRHVDEYIGQHSTAVNAYYDNIFHNSDNQKMFESVFRGDGKPTGMSRWPV